MKLQVKLTNREKRLIIMLSLVLILGGYYNFIFKPQLDKIDELQTQSENLKEQAEKVRLEISPNSPVKKEFKIMNAKTKTITKRLFPSIDQEKIIVILDDLLNKSALTSNSIGFSDIDINVVEVKKSEKKDKNYLLKDLKSQYDGFKVVKSKANNSNNEKSNDSEKVEKLTATIAYKGKYKDIINFLSQVEQYDKKIVVSNLTIASNSGNNEQSGNAQVTDNTQTANNIQVNEPNSISGNIVLDFYAIPKLHKQDAEYLKWDFNGGYGKDDPFVPFGGYVTYNNNINNPKNQTDQSDFLMSVDPISSDLPNVILGRNMDKVGKTFVYADNPNYENVEIQLIQQGKKYYYKYRTQGESYPKNYEAEKEEFQPRGTNVNLDIISNARNGEDDISGVNLTLINKTNLQLNVKLGYEDNKRPRVKIVNKTGNVNILK